MELLVGYVVRAYANKDTAALSGAYPSSIAISQVASSQATACSSRCRRLSWPGDDISGACSSSAFRHRMQFQAYSTVSIHRSVAS